MIPNRCSVLLAACMISLVISGCGGGMQTYPVQGKVQFANGKRWPEAVSSF